VQKLLHERTSPVTADIVSTFDSISIFEQQRQSKLPNKVRVFGSDIA